MTGSLPRSKQLKTLVTLSLAGLALLAGTAHAQGMPLATTTGSDIGIQLSGYKYEEQVGGAFFMSTEGNKLGLSGSFTQAHEDGWFWGGDIRYASGHVEYRSAGTGEMSGVRDYYVDARLTFGQDFESSGQVWAPYTGLGYRHLNNDLRGFTSTGAIGYRRTSEYIYIPLGVTHRFRLDSEARFATTLEYDFLLQGRQRSYLTDTSPLVTSDADNLQRRGYGLRLNLAYETPRWSAGVFVHYWDIADSDVGTYTIAPNLVDSVYEPQNTTREVGVMLKYRFN